MRPELVEELWAVSPRVFGHIRWAEWLQLEADWGVVVLADVPADGPGAVTVGSSNLMLGARYPASPQSGPTSLSFSVAATVPLATDGDAPRGQSRAGLALALGMRGMWDPWLWGPEQTGLTLGAVLHQSLGEPFHLMAEADVASTVSVGDASDKPLHVYGQAAVELYQDDGETHVGLRVQAVAFNADGDALQLSFGPFLGFGVGSTWMSLRWLVNLDAPLGVWGPGLVTMGLFLTASFPV